MPIQWSLVVFSLFAGAAAASLVFIGLAEITGKAKKAGFLVSVVAAVLLLIGGIAAVLHLGNPGNVMSAVANLFSFSGISLELIFLGLSLVAAIAYAVASKRDAAGATKAIGIVGLVLGLILCVVLGSSYMLGARPSWDNIGLPLSYFGSGLAMGAFIFLAIASIVKVELAEIKAAGLWALVASIVALVAYLLYGLLSGVAFNAAFALIFWIAAVVIGAVIPIACGVLLGKGDAKPALPYVGLAAAALGAISFRMIMWSAGTGVLDIFALGDLHQPFL